MAQPSRRTYQRLIKKIVVEMAALQPGANPARVTLLNKRFKKYQERINSFT